MIKKFKICIKLDKFVQNLHTNLYTTCIKNYTKLVYKFAHKYCLYNFINLRKKLVKVYRVRDTAWAKVIFMVWVRLRISVTVRFNARAWRLRRLRVRNLLTSDLGAWSIATWELRIL